MTSNLYLSRARLRKNRGEALSAIAPLLIPDDPKLQAGHAHSVLWLLFQDTSDAKRDFLWRDEGDGKYMLLSQRPPIDPLGLFELDTKPFEPSLQPGDNLSFSLRANPVLARKSALTRVEHAQRKRGKRVDIVMDALKSVPPGKRAAVRDEITSRMGTEWLTKQGLANGFTLLSAPVVDGYSQVPVERRRGAAAGFSVLNLTGKLQVNDPAAFLARLPQGFGSAKAFGNGLMLIRRA